MLKQETIEALAKLAKLKTEDLKAAIENKDEVDLAVAENLTTFDADEVSSLKKNSYNEGKTAGVEIAVKATKEKLNLDFQGKTVDGLVEAAQKKAVEDAKIPVDKKVTELETKVSTLQKTVQEQEKTLADKDKEVQTVKLNGELAKNIPAGAALESDEVIELMKLKGYSFETKEGKLVVSKDGQVLQDKVANPLPAKDVITDFLKEKKLISEDPPGRNGGPDPAGRGGGGKPPVTYTRISEIKKQFETEGKSTLGQEFNDAVMKAKADNKDFDMNS